MTYPPYTMPSMPILEMLVNNALYTSAFPWKVDTESYEGEFSPVCVDLPAEYHCYVRFQVGDIQAYLACQSDSWLYNHPAFEAVQDKKTLNVPLELKQALLENALEPYFYALENLVETSVRIQESIFITDNYSTTDMQSFFNNFENDYARINFRFDFDKSPASQSSPLFFSIFIPAHMPSDSLVAKLKTLNPAEQSSKIPLSQIPFELSFEAGYSVLCKHDVAQLGLGDIIIPDEYYMQDAKLKAVIGAQIRQAGISEHTSPYTLCSLEGDKAVILQSFHLSTQNILHSTEDFFMEEHVLEQDSNIAEDVDNVTQQANIEDITSNLDVVLSFELERRSVTLAEIQNMTEGYSFAMNCDKNSPITLRLNGKAVGQGKLVDMNGTIGVQITKLGK